MQVIIVISLLLISLQNTVDPSSAIPDAESDGSGSLGPSQLMEYLVDKTLENTSKVGAQDLLLRYNCITGCCFRSDRPYYSSKEITSNWDQSLAARVAIDAHIEKSHILDNPLTLDKPLMQDIVSTLVKQLASKPRTFLPIKIKSVQYTKKNITGIEGVNSSTEAYVKLNSDCASIDFTFELKADRWQFKEGMAVFATQSNGTSWIFCRIKKKTKQEKFDFHTDKTYHFIHSIKYFSCHYPFGEQEKIRFAFVIRYLGIELDMKPAIENDPASNTTKINPEVCGLEKLFQ